MSANIFILNLAGWWCLRRPGRAERKNNTDDPSWREADRPEAQLWFYLSRSEALRHHRYETVAQFDFKKKQIKKKMFADVFVPIWLALPLKSKHIFKQNKTKQRARAGTLRQPSAE